MGGSGSDILFLFCELVLTIYRYDYETEERKKKAAELKWADISKFCCFARPMNRAADGGPHWQRTRL
jgi:hypothetical protein